MDKEIEFVKPNETNTKEVLNNLRMIYYLGVVNGISLLLGCLFIYKREFIYFILITILFIITLPPNETTMKKRSLALRKNLK